MLQFTNKDYPNFHLNIKGEGIEVVVTLNITADMRQFMSPNNCCHTGKRNVYILRTTVLMQQMNEQRILSIANKLINSAMIHSREAKQKVLDLQIERIKMQTPRITTSNSLF